MLQLVQDGRIIDIILGLVLLEAIALAVLRAARGQGPGLAGMFFNLAAGAALMLALRSALSGAGPLIISVWLAVALLAHLLDLVGRFREKAPIAP